MARAGPDRSRPRILTRRLIPALVAIALGACAGCRSLEPPLQVHYLPQFVAGTRNLYRGATIALAPPGGIVARGRVKVGAIYGPDGTVQRRLYVEHFSTALRRALARGLRDAGLEVIASRAAPADRPAPSGIDFALAVTVEGVNVDKHFGAQTTVHGRYFTMHSRVRLGIMLFDRAAHPVFSGEVVGSEDEPPAPVGGEVFLPLETDPAESLSVALSRAVGALILEPGIRRALPRPH